MPACCRRDTAHHWALDSQKRERAHLGHTFRSAAPDTWPPPLPAGSEWVYLGGVDVRDPLERRGPQPLLRSDVTTAEQLLARAEAGGALVGAPPQRARLEAVSTRGMGFAHGALHPPAAWRRCSDWGEGVWLRAASAPPALLEQFAQPADDEARGGWLWLHTALTACTSACSTRA